MQNSKLFCNTFFKSILASKIDWKETVIDYCWHLFSMANLVLYILQIPQMVLNSKAIQCVFFAYFFCLIFFTCAHYYDPQHEYRMTVISKHFSLTPFYIVALINQLYQFITEIISTGIKWLSDRIIDFCNCLWQWIDFFGQLIWKGIKWLGDRIIELSNYLWKWIDFCRQQILIVWNFVYRWLNYCNQKIKYVVVKILMFFWEWLCLPIWNIIQLMCKKVIAIYWECHSLIIYFYWQCHYLIIDFYWQCHYLIIDTYQKRQRLIIDIYCNCYQTITNIPAMISAQYAQTKNSLESLFAKLKKD